MSLTQLVITPCRERWLSPGAMGALARLVSKNALGYQGHHYS